MGLKGLRGLKSLGEDAQPILSQKAVTQKAGAKGVKKLLSCEINGHTVKVPEGSSVIEAFKQLEQDICHYCWHPGLSVAGVCRLCMVEIEGQGKLQIACNTKVQEGMKISNQSEKVQTAVRWGLEYHLINHPLDCPICDQAGECSLQDQYMKFSSYDPSMAEAKVKKRKLVSLGSKIVLDTERCILCSRCVRFTDEVSKTHELGIFNRGDRSEIGCFDDKPLENDYALNTVDICPVGALTSKEFRFKQRVWYLKTAKSICTGCSTGCNTFVDYNEEGVWRVRPRFNENVNGHWMCDKGRGLFEDTHRKNRLNRALMGLSLAEGEGDLSLSESKRDLSLAKAGNNWKSLSTKAIFEEIQKHLKEPQFVLTGQYSNEEYSALLSAFPKSEFYYWINNEEEFDDFDDKLLRGDKNPNTKGLRKIFPKMKSLKKWQAKGKCLVVFGPENTAFYPDLEQKSQVFSQAKVLVWFGLIQNPYLKAKSGVFQIPIKSSFEKEGTYINHQGLEQKVKKIQTLNSQALSVQESLQLLTKQNFNPKQEIPYFKQNQFLNNKRKVW